MTSVNYTGRTVDLLLSSDWKSSGSFILNGTILADPQICTGVQKVAQTFALLLLTRRGSVQSDPTFGTNFLNGVDSGINSETALISLFNLAVSDIKSYLRTTVTATTPLDEQFVNATLDSISVYNGMLNMSVTLTTGAGADRAVIVPVGVPIK